MTKPFGRIGTKSAHQTIAAGNGQRQPPTVLFETAAQPPVFSRLHEAFLSFLGLGNLALSGIVIFSGLLLSTHALSLCLTCLALSLFTFLLRCGTGSLTPGSFLFPPCLGNATLVFLTGSLGSCFLTGQFLSTLTGSLLLGLLLGFSLLTGLLAGYLLGNELVDAGIELLFAALLLKDEGLNSLLLLLQLVHLNLLFVLLTL